MTKKTNKRTIVTSALPYANGSIHVGHLVEYIQTDIFVRFVKLIGEDVVFCCADDAHGTPIELKASELNIKPQDLIEKFYKEHLRDFTSFHIKFDSYHTTHSKENQHFSELIFKKLKENDLIYQKEVENFYDEKEKRFLPDRYVKGECPKCQAKDQYGDVCEKCNATYKPIDLVNPYSVISKQTPIRKKSNHYFFKLSKMSNFLDKWLKNNNNLQTEVVNYVRNWIKEGLEDWDISRDGPYFGFKIPNEENKFFYVWLDAPIGYIASYANYLKGDVKKAEQDWNNSKIIHFIGKDITYFHFLFWPAMLHGAGFNIPDTINVHGFLTVNGEKMSKSRGTFFTAKDFVKKYKPEFLRYYYASFLSKKLQDIDLDFKDFHDKINNELVGNIANFSYRVLSFTNKNFKGEFKELDTNNEVVEKINKKIQKIKNKYNDLNFNEVVKEINSISDIGNKYFQENEPWKLIKEDKEKVQKICGLGINIAKNLSILISPILPEFSKELQKQLKVKNLTWNDLNFELKNHKIGKEKIIIQKLEEIKEEKFPLNLKVAKILDVKPHPEADKLLILEIDLGAEKRQLVAGLKPYYKTEELIGKNLIVVTNLKYAKLRGIESQGMLLACEGKNNKVGVLTIIDAKPGEIVKVGNLENDTKQIKFEEFTKIKIKAKKDKVIFEKNELKVNNKNIFPDKGIEGNVR